MLADFIAQIRVRVRSASESDLPALEWWGWHRDHREIIRYVFDQSLRGESIMIVADSRGFPIGQTWVDLIRKKDEGAGVLWAVRVIPGFHGCGIGSRLIFAAEQSLRDLGYDIAEIGVEPGNKHARDLYIKLGYQLTGREVDTRAFRNASGAKQVLITDQWILRKSLGGAVGSSAA
jgi:ribosomal protein S18 acetylase RimI-like enzyme